MTARSCSDRDRRQDKQTRPTIHRWQSAMKPPLPIVSTWPGGAGMPVWSEPDWLVALNRNGGLLTGIRRHVWLQSKRGRPILLAMKKRHRHTPKCDEPVGFSIVRRDHRLALPSSFATYRLGQRVYFHITPRGLVMSDRPKRTTNGRFPSSRIRRGVRSLNAYG
jgi:hypothetical protein